MRVSNLYNLLAPIYGRVAPAMFDRLNIRAVQRLGAGGPQSILEVAIGPGRLLGRLSAKHSDKARIVGVDMARGMLKEARQHLEKSLGTARLVQADGLHLPFASGRFDAAVATFFLDVLPQEDLQPALAELTRTITPGGRLILGSFRVNNSLLRQGWMMTYNVIPDLVGRIRPIEVDQYFADVGLRVLRDEEVPDFTGVRMLTLMKATG